MVTKLSKSDALLFQTYAKRTDSQTHKFYGTVNGVSSCAARSDYMGPYILSTHGLVHTSEGKPALWRFLTQQGLVEGHNSPFGHPFNFTLTEKGASLVEDICREENRALGLETP